MKFMKASILIMLIMGICLLTACGPKEENTTTDNVDSSITFEDALEESKVDAFKDKYGDKLPWGGSGNKTGTGTGIQGT